MAFGGSDGQHQCIFSPSVTGAQNHYQGATPLRYEIVDTGPFEGVQVAAMFSYKKHIQQAKRIYSRVMVPMKGHGPLRFNTEGRCDQI
jgi:hypothetical protein